MTVTLDDKVINSAQIQSEIDGPGQITGIGTITDAQNLAALLKYGALPLPLTVVSEPGDLAPTIGQQALEFSIRAAIVGLGMVVLFMLVYYRLPGLLADIALILYALLLFAVIKLLGVTLSLPGIAGCDPDDWYGGGREYPDIRADERGVTRGPHDGVRRRSRLQTRLALHPRLELLDAHHLPDSVLVRQ